MGLSGILNVNKPAGCTSFSIITRLRGLTGIRRIGHAGTLDPLASGVLPVCLGQATRVIEFIMGGIKEYICGIELGTTTDTYDAEGKILEHRSFVNITLSDIEKALTDFQGDIEQVPPAYSAIKIKGRPYYEIARAGQPDKPAPRTVYIESLKLTGFDLPNVQLTVRCGKGTYMRSLAHDLGQSIGCGAYVKDLVRSAYGPFTLAESVTLEAIESAIGCNRLDDLLYQADYALLSWPRVILSEEQAQDIISGRDISLPVTIPEGSPYYRAYTSAGRFLAIMKFVYESGMWHPEKVFA